MTSRPVSRVATGVLALLLGLSGVASSAASARVDDVDRVFTRQLDSSRVPGGAYAVVTGREIDSAGVGTAGDAGSTAATPFVIGSTTKSFTALAVMQLVDSGGVNLDDPVRDYVPELVLADGEDLDAIEVRHVLQQTSGLDDLAGGPLLASASDGTPLAAVAELRDAELLSAPGERWRYANINYVLAGLVVERASGMSYADYAEQRIFKPLGMADSTAAGRPPGVSPGHRFWFGVPIQSEPVVRQAMMAAGYLVSTSADLGRYLAMYLAGGLSEDGTRVISATGLRTLLSPGPRAELGPWAAGKTSRYAMGWFVGGPWAARVVFHPGNSPDTSAMLALAPEQKIAVATLVNAGHELPVPGNPALTDRIARNVVHAALGEPVPAAPTLTSLYLVFDLVALVLVLLAGVGVVRAAAAWRRARQPSHVAAAVAGVVLRGVGVVVLLITVGFKGWSTMATWAPDLAVLIALLAVLLAVATVIRVGWLLRLRRPAQA